MLVDTAKLLLSLMITHSGLFRVKQWFHSKLLVLSYKKSKFIAFTIHAIITPNIQETFIAP